MVLVPRELAGGELRLRVDGLIDGQVVASGVGTAVLVADRVVVMVILLGDPALCGDGVIDPAVEECDDGNLTGGDGCSASCRVEAGYTCTGSPSICELTCGNGVFDGSEACYDNNFVSGDGCSSACEVEPGYECTGWPSVCTASGCGDGVVGPTEQCDDGNLIDDDGCDGSCEVEPGWTCELEPSQCTQTCGDGLCDLTGGEDHVTCQADCGWALVDLGLASACGVKNDGTVWCWGEGGDGQLGQGSTADSSTPVQVSGLTDAVDLGVGARHACALTAGGEVWCWGENVGGKLGDGTFGGLSTSPVQVLTVTNGQSLSAGAVHTCVVLGNQSQWCWGVNAQGRLGDGSTVDRAIPVQVSGLSGVVALGLHDHSCAATGTGAAHCWGRNAAGELGMGFTSGPQLTPQAVQGVSGVVAMGAGVGFSCARTTTGQGWCWGDNQYGRLGDGTSVDRLSPVQVTVSGALSALHPGGRYACAIRASDGTVVLGQQPRRSAGQRHQRRHKPHTGTGHRHHGCGGPQLLAFQLCRAHRRHGVVLGLRRQRRARQRRDRQQQRAGPGHRPLLKQ